jgi:hypothetical protein
MIKSLFAAKQQAYCQKTPENIHVIEKITREMKTKNRQPSQQSPLRAVATTGTVR